MFIVERRAGVLLREAPNKREKEAISVKTAYKERGLLKKISIS